MAYINVNNRPTISSACDLFSLPPVNRSAVEGYYQEYRTTAALDSGSLAPLEFVISPSDTEYIDIANTRLRIKAKIFLADGTALPANCQVAPVNNWLHSLFSQVSVDLNQKCITPCSGLYPYRAMIENTLNYGCDAKNSHLQSSLYYKDTGGIMSAVAENAGYIARRARNGDEIEMESAIHSDIFNINKYIPNGVQIAIKLYRSSPEFALVSTLNDTQKYKIKITEAILIVRKIKINPSILAAHSLTLEKYTAKFPITRCEIRHTTIPRGVQTTSLDSLVFGQLPKRVIVCMVDADAFNGSLHTNPFNFQHFNYNYMNVVCESSLHNTPLKPNFDLKQYVNAYNTLFYGTGSGFSDGGPDLSYKDYANGYAFAIFDLTPDQTASSSHINQPKSGSLRIELQFAKALTNAVVALTFLEFSNLIEIDKHRDVFLDYST